MHQNLTFFQQELTQDQNIFEQKASLENSMIYGLYPEVALQNNIQHLQEIVNSYLYQDILEHQRIKKSHILNKLLQALALQI